MGSNPCCPSPAHKWVMRCCSVCWWAIPPSSRGIIRGARPTGEQGTLNGLIQGEGSWQLWFSGVESEAGQAHGTWKEVMRPALRKPRSACSMQVCPSVPPSSGAELQRPRATQPGQFREQLEPAARDKQMMPFFSWQEDFFRFISYTARCIQVITPVRQRSPLLLHILPVLPTAVTHSWAPPPSTVAEPL